MRNDSKRNLVISQRESDPAVEITLTVRGPSTDGWTDPGPLYLMRGARWESILTEHMISHCIIAKLLSMHPYPMGRATRSDILGNVTSSALAVSFWAFPLLLQSQNPSQKLSQDCFSIKTTVHRSHGSLGIFSRGAVKASLCVTIRSFFIRCAKSWQVCSTSPMKQLARPKQSDRLLNL